MQKNLTTPLSEEKNSQAGIMMDVIIAIIPAAVYGMVIFGWRAALVVAVCICSAVLSEFLWNKALKKQNTLADLSAVLTGLLLAMNLPSSLPLYMAALGSAVAIIVVKQMFGGLGHNFANPAVTAKIVLLVSFPMAMTRFFEPFSSVITSSTPLTDSASYSLRELLFGMHGGAIGETSAVMLTLGGVYLILRRVISPIIPVSFITSACLLSFLVGENPLKAVLSGGLLLGAFFMATDYTTSPKHKWGKLVFGIGCGIITVLIRKFAQSYEGVAYAILVMNLFVPHIDALTSKFKLFGWRADKNE